MKIHIPNSVWLGNIDPFIRSFDSSNPDTLELGTHPKWMSVHPVVLSMLAALGTKTKNVSCDLKASSKHYFERMKLLDFLNVKFTPTIIEHEPAGRFIPLTQIKTSNELTNFIKDMVPLLHLEPEQADPIKYVISELVRNVLEHAESSEGAFICAQFYKKSNIIRLGIADSGVGIKRTINFSYAAENHLEAIRLALMPGITGTTNKEGGTEFNAGAGLFFIKSIAAVNKDFFIIYSGNAMYKLLKSKKIIKLNADPFDDNHSKDQDYPFWQGTVIGIDISLDQKKEFSWLLELIRETYSNAIRERKKRKYRRPRFI